MMSPLIETGLVQIADAVKLVHAVKNALDGAVVLVVCFVLYQFICKIRETTDTTRKIMEKLLIIEERLDWQENYVANVEEWLHEHGKIIKKTNERVESMGHWRQEYVANTEEWQHDYGKKIHLRNQ